jgi:hypothetical protein
MHEAHVLSQQARRLGEEQRTHADTLQRLEQRITQGELAYGELLRKSFELRRALDTRRQHLNEDKAALEREKLFIKSKGDEMNAIMAKITSITAAVDTTSVKHES